MKLRLLTCLLCAGISSGALAYTLPPGTLLAVDQLAGAQHRGSLFTVDQNTGQRTVFSDFNDASQGAVGVDPNGASWLPAQLLGLIPSALLVTDGSAGTDGRGALYKVDPTTGQRSLLSDFGNSAQGPLGLYPEAVLAVPPGLLSWSGVLVCDPLAGTDQRGALFSVDANGQRTTIIDFGDTGGYQGVYPSSMALYGGLLGLGRSVLVADGSAGTNAHGVLFRIDPLAKTRTIVSDFGDSTQGWVDPNPASTPLGIVVSPANRVYVLIAEVGSGDAGKLVEVDVATGYRTLISDLDDPTQGAVGVNPTGITWLPAYGRLAITDNLAGTGGNGALFLVDPGNGKRTLLSDFGSAAQGPLGVAPAEPVVTQ